MIRPSLRGTAVLTSAVTVAAGLSLLAAPASAAATTVNFNAACRGNVRVTNADEHSSLASGVTVDAPASVVTGQTFTYRLQPNQMVLPKDGPLASRYRASISRIKFDYEVPAGAQFVSATVVPGTGSANLTGVSPSVKRINAAGSPDANGPFLRLSGVQTTGNGPETSDASQGGIVVNAGSGDTAYRLPAIEVTAIAGPAGSVITPKVRTTGNAANYNNPENFFTAMIEEKDPVFQVSYWVTTNCVPKNGVDPASSVPLNAGAGPLATINVTTPPDVATTTALTAPATATQGESVTLSAAVSPAQAGGTVEFFDGATSIGTAPVTAGTATLAHTFTSTGAHSVKAVYSGATGFVGSTSAVQVVTVNALDVATTTTLTAPGTATQGKSATLSASVSPAAASGTVEFFDGATSIGSVPVTDGVATLAYPFTSTGAHSVKAVYGGAAGFLGSTSGTQVVNVEAPAPTDVATTTTLTVPGTGVQGEYVTLSATVSPAQAGGTVQFFDGATAVGAPAKVNAGGVTLAHKFTTTGAHTVKAVYSGAAGFLGSSSTSVITVSAATTPPATGGNGSFG